jgi:pyruvate dehydrogenase E1 component alpha subunit/2-oxoisovalerate dehydrogenase E1 component alpha subunit
MVPAMATAPLQDAAAQATLHSRPPFLEAFRWMLLARIFEERLASLYRAGKIHGGVFLGTGQEALSAALGLQLRRGLDLFGPLIRDMAGRLAFGESLDDVARTYLGSALGPMRGRDGNIHRGRPREGIYPMISHLGTMVSTVSGGLLARRLAGTLGSGIGATCMGDGGTSTGSFHEGMNLAAVERLPLVVVVANNQYAYSTPNNRQFACADLLDRAAGYGFAGHAVDGTDLDACLRTLQTAVARARAGHGPQMVVARLLRLAGHGEHDDASYVDPKWRASPEGADCLKLARQRILDAGWASAEDLEHWRGEAVNQIDHALALAQSDPAPDPRGENWAAISTARLREQAPE